jgi:ABC-2 type transport system permease protein
MPFFGFNQHNLLRSPSLRQQFGLAQLPANLSLEQAIVEQQGDFSTDYDWVNFETVISTANDEVAIAQGELIDQWQENGRNFYHYKTSGNTEGDKIRNALAYLSGRYQVANRTVDGVNLAVYYHNNHQQNVEHMLAAMTATMQYANQCFGRYPAKDLRLVEVPRILRMTGYALPQVLLIGEHGGFRDDLSEQPNEHANFDQVYRRTAHEVAHQWWGHGLNGADQEGGSVLVETLAKYTELMLLEHKYGKEYVRRLLKHEHQRYFTSRARSTENEVPLYRADANYLIYSKGAIAMYALKEAMGEQVINSALRQLIDKYSYPKPPATTLDLIAALQAFAQPEQLQLIEQWFKEIVIDDLSITSASYQQLSDTLYQVDVCLKGQQQSLGGLAKSSLITDKKSVWLGILTAHPDELITRGSDVSVLKLEQVDIDSQNQCLSWTVIEKPSYVAIDPFYQLLDPERDNNVVVPIKSLLN